MSLTTHVLPGRPPRQQAPPQGSPRRNALKYVQVGLCRRLKHFLLMFPWRPGRGFTRHTAGRKSPRRRRQPKCMLAARRPSGRGTRLPPASIHLQPLVGQSPPGGRSRLRGRRSKESHALSNGPPCYRGLERASLRCRRRQRRRRGRRQRSRAERQQMRTVLILLSQGRGRRRSQVPSDLASGFLSPLSLCFRRRGVYLNGLVCCSRWPQSEK